MDSVLLECSATTRNQAEARRRRSSGHWKNWRESPQESQSPPLPSLRYLAAEEMKRRGIDYIVVFSADFYADDYRRNRLFWNMERPANQRRSPVPPAMNLFLGVDGGQSSTTALIGDGDGRVLGTGSGGPCNHVGAAEGARKLRSSVSACVAQACEGAGIDPGTVRFASACFGMSGGPADKQAILAEILGARTLTVTTDAVIALAGATAGEPGSLPLPEPDRSPTAETPPAAPRGREAGAISSAMRGAASILCAKPCAPRCGMTKDGVRRPRCEVCCSKRPEPLTRTMHCTASIPRIGRAPHRFARACWSTGRPMQATVPPAKS